MELYLHAGNPNDANREYVPTDIKNVDHKMTVNENGNNSICYPDNLMEFHETLLDGRVDTWYEYVPSTYDGSRPVPLVVSNHGGLMNGWAQAIYSSWTLLAEREGFICVFPDAHDFQMWTIMGMADRFKDVEDHLPIPEEPEDYHDNQDLNFVKALIRHTQEKYNIDAGRIYMQGMSMGHMMTDQFARYYGDLLAGAAGSGASPVASQLYDAEGKRINYGGPVDIWISHPEWNGMGADDDAEHRDQRNGREYWGAVNECDMVPQIRIEGEYNYAFYTGKKGNMVWVDIKNRDHGQALDEAFLYWKYLFSGVRRDGEGNLVHTRTMEDRTGDKFGIAVADGVKKAWFRNQAVELTTAPVLWQKLKYHGLNGGQMVRGEYLCVPVSFLAEVFGAEYTPSPDTLEATVKLQDGRTVQFARGIIGAMVDQELTAMYCEALHRNGELLVSVEWFCKYLFGLEVTSNHGMVYITDHFAELSQFMAELIRDLLK